MFSCPPSEKSPLFTLSKMAKMNDKFFAKNVNAQKGRKLVLMDEIGAANNKMVISRKAFGSLKRLFSILKSRRNFTKCAHLHLKDML